MTNPQLAHHDLLALILLAGAWFVLGALIGALHFLTLRWNARLFASGQSLRLALGTQLVRFALVAGALAVIAIHFGALPLLIAAAGILAARTAVVQSGAQP